MFFSLFLVETLPFFIFLALAFVLITVFVAVERGDLATVGLVASVLILVTCTNVHPMDRLTNNIVDVLEYTAAYLIGGVVWSTFKWWRFVLRARDVYTDFVRSTLEARGQTTIEALIGPGQGKFASKEEFDTHIRNQLPEPFTCVKFPLKSSKFKGKILTWMTYWPASFAWWLSHAPITRLYNFLYKSMVSVYDSIAKSANPTGL